MGKRIHLLFACSCNRSDTRGSTGDNSAGHRHHRRRWGARVIGASVIVKKELHWGTVTDVNGRFELSGLPPSATRLLISYISLMAKEVAIAPQVSVTLKSDTHLLDEVVVNGFGYFTREKWHWAIRHRK